MDCDEETHSYISEDDFNARKMLSYCASRYTIEAVAIDSGFGSTRTFYRLFRRNQGLTPEEFRKLSIM